jgi:carbon storage regulator
VLILSRREAECIHLGEDIVLTIVALGNDKVRIGVQAPPGIRILRSELEVESATLPMPTQQPKLSIPTTARGLADMIRARKAA